MDRIAKALAARDEVFAEISDVLFGGGADSLISKLTEQEKKFQRRQAQVGLATNVVGIGAGVAATPGAIKDARKAYKDYKGAAKTAEFNRPLPGMPKAPGPLSAGLKAIPKNKKVALATATGLAGLQVANLGGDFVANRVLGRAAKKKVQKNNPDGADLHVPGKNELRLKAVKAAVPAAKKIKDKVVDKHDDSVDVVWSGEFSKVDDEKRQVFGYASVVEVDGEPVVDRQGDYISIDEVEKSAYDYVQKSRKGGDMHRRNGSEPHHVSDMIESFVITKEKIEKMGLPAETPLGWWVGFKVNDDATWDKVKSGERTGFSIHGRGSRVEKVLS